MFYAVTTVERHPNTLKQSWMVVGVGDTREEAEQDANDTLGPMNHESFTSQTEHKNLRIVTREEAIENEMVSADQFPVWEEGLGLYRLEHV